MADNPAKMFLFLFLGLVLALLAALLFADHLRTRWLTRDGLNSTADWLPASPDRFVKPPAGNSLVPADLRLITSHLEAGETLEGFTRAAFVPNPTPDWNNIGGAYGFPLLFAVTSQRIILFQFSCLALRLSSFILLDDIWSLEPPKPGLWGTSGPVKFGLKSGRAYKLMLFGPVLNPEAMQYEQKLAAYLRELAERLPGSMAA